MQPRLSNFSESQRPITAIPGLPGAMIEVGVLMTRMWAFISARNVHEVFPQVKFNRHRYSE